MEHYVIFLVDQQEVFSFNGFTVQTDEKFGLTDDQVRKVNDVVNTQYADACINQYFIQENTSRIFRTSKELEEAKIQYQKTKKRFNRRCEKEQKSKLKKYDRYFYTYKNSVNETLILIQFDPHKVKWYSIAGEHIIDNLSMLTYNFDQDILRYSGWAEFKEY